MLAVTASETWPAASVVPLIVAVPLLKLLLAEWDLLGENIPSNGKFIDIVILVLTGGRERSADQYRELLASAGFRLSRVVPTAAQFALFEAFPV